MLIGFGTTTGVDHRSAARVRGAAAGLISGSTSVGAHAWATDGTVPDGTAIVLLGAAAAALGALVTGVRAGAVGLAAALSGGQLLGHFCLSWGSGHLSHGDLRLSPAMVAAHILVGCAAAVLVRGVEYAYRTAVGALSGLVPLLVHSPDTPEPAPLRSYYRNRLILWLLDVRIGRTRAPPPAPSI